MLMVIGGFLVKYRDVEGVIPLRVLEQTCPLGESRICQDKRLAKCATLCCKIQVFSDCCCVLTKIGPVRHVPADVLAAAFCTVPIIRGSREVAWPRFGRSSNRGSVFAAIGAGGGAPRCRCAFLASACIWGWQWCWCLPGMPGRHQRRRGSPGCCRFRCAPWAAGVSGGATDSR